jgi:hypothetical protein
MRRVLLTVFGWLFRAFAVLLAIGVGFGQYYDHTNPDPINAPLMATSAGVMGYYSGFALVVVFLVAIYAIGSKLLKLRTVAAG